MKKNPLFPFHVTLLLLLLLGLPCINSEGDVIYVDNSNSTASDVICTPCANITGALLKVSNNHTQIKVCPGTYNPVGKVTDYTNFTNIEIIGLFKSSSYDCKNEGIVEVNCYRREIDCRDRIEDHSLTNITYKRAFDVKNSSITRLENLYIKECDASVITWSFLNITNCVFFGNCGELGGSLYFLQSEVHVVDTLFDSNAATVRGGAVSFDSSYYTFEGSNFTRNEAMGYKENTNKNIGLESNVGGRGGAIFSFGSLNDQHVFDYMSSSKSGGNKGLSGQFMGCRFIGNKASLDGGAITLLSIYDFQITFTDVIFENNTLYPLSSCIGGDCNVRGGAVYSSNSPSFFNLCIFRFNSIATIEIGTYAEGGAIFSTAPNIVSESNDKSMLQVYDSLFELNSVNSFEQSIYGGYGGAVYVVSQTVYFSKVDFISNSVGALESSLNLFPQITSGGGAIYFSEPNGESFIDNCKFYGNYVVGGAGGAIKFLSVAKTVRVSKSSFDNNSAWSSYTMKAQGGAILLTKESIVYISASNFTYNSAIPREFYPLTNSGEGGAIYSQSSCLMIGSNSNFFSNLVRTGQFDSGSGGGAILMEDSYNSSINNSTFVLNGAAGLNRVSTYAEAGSGGAIYLKFSFATVSSSIFDSNWATAGGIQYSFGGAISCFYEYVTSKASPIQIYDSKFMYNVAFGVVSSYEGNPDLRAGQGGALAVLGVTEDAVLMQNVSFVGNVADSDPDEPIFSSGGAIATAQGSRLNCEKCDFIDNIAIGGFGNDIATPASSESVDSFVLNGCYLSPITNGSATMVVHKKRILHDIVRSVTAKEYNLRGEQLLEHHLLTGYYDANVNLPGHDQMLGFELNDDMPFERDIDMHFGDFAHSVISISCSAGSIQFRGFNNFSSMYRGDRSGYHIFLGNIISILEPQYNSLDYTNAKLEILGTISPNTIIISSVSSVITVHAETELSRLNAINSTLYFGKDVIVTDEATLSGSTFYPIREGRNGIGKSFIEFRGKVLYGSSGPSSGRDTCIGANVVKSRTMLDIYTNHHLKFSGIDLHLSGIMYTATNMLLNTTEEMIHVNNSQQAMAISLYENSSIMILPSGLLSIRAPTVIESGKNGVDHSCYFQNEGEISITSEDQRFTTFKVLNCEYIQSVEGVLNITLNNDFQSQSVIYLENNRSIAGKINTTFAEGTTVTLYDGDASTFDVISFRDIGIDGEYVINNTLEYTAYDGVQFQAFNERISESSDNKYAYNYVTELVVSSMNCDAITEYYAYPESLSSDDGVQKSNYLCHICLYNPSCHYCNGACQDVSRDNCGGGRSFFKKLLL